MDVRKIVILGPESTGKSVLCQQLAEHYNTTWCPEYAREYLLEHGTSYTYDDLLTIARNQLLKEDDFVAKAQGKPVVFIDTDMHVMQVWCEFVFDKCHRFILDQVIERKYDLFLLCNNDLPWVKDELREYPDLENRVKLFHMYKDLLVNQDVPWVEISGDYDERLPVAIKAVDALLAREL